LALQWWELSAAYAVGVRRDILKVNPFADLFNFEVESTVVFSCFFDFEDFEVVDLAGVFDVGLNFFLSY